MTFWGTYRERLSAKCLTLLVFFALGVAVPALAQNSKGDRSVGNQRQVRETRSKSVKKRERAKTKDIAGRRLRTKDKSSASRANASHPQPNPYSSRPRIANDRPAKSTGRIYSERPRERQRSWRGDVSGSSIKRVKPRSAEAARSNVYPQRGVYVNNPSKKPKREKAFHSHSRTATGQPIVRRVPQQKQRAWRGNIQGGSVGSPSATGSVKNTFPQKNKYSRYTGKKDKGDRRTFSNRSYTGRAFSAGPISFRKGKAGSPLSASRSYTQRGRKNVYWGKFSKGERAVTSDLTGRPVRTRNFRSLPAGLVGRDTLKFFGRKPGGDRASSGRAKAKGFKSSTPRESRGWRGDVSGWKLRRLQPKKSIEVAGERFFPRKLSVSQSGKRGRPMPGTGFQSRSKPPEGKPGSALPPLSPGIGAKRISKALVNAKGVRPIKGGGSISGRAWNNNRTPIDPRIPPGGAQAGKFSGNIRRDQRPGFGDQGEGFSGYIKARRPAKGGGSISGRLWNNNRTPIDPRIPPGGAQAGKFSGNIRRDQRPGFSDQGEGFSGYIKARRPVKGGGSVSGKLWNNNGEPVDVIRAGRGTVRASQFQGNIKGGRPAKGGGSVSGKLWNNRGQPIDVFQAGQGTVKAARFQGNIKGGKPVKGGGSISGKLWNNNGQPIDVFQAGKGTVRASQFQGNIKTGRPAKGGGSVSGKLWNNNEEPIDVFQAGKGTVRASQFQGNVKAKRPAKGGGSISGKLWNNNEEPILVRVPSATDAKEANYSGRKKIKNAYTQNPNASDLSIKKQRPDKTTYLVDGLQVRVKRDSYDKKPNAAAGSLRGLGPSRATVRASEYERGIKIIWNTKQNPNSAEGALAGRKPTRKWERGVEHAGSMKARYPYRHNPNSADDALKVVYLGKAYARIEDWQGNTKMRKFNDRRLHPDSKFAHSHNDNVKEERTILTNVKLLWAKLFRKSETQPDHLKRNERRPRYDKGEKGMWND